MSRTYTKKDLLEQLQTTISEIEYLKRLLDKQWKDFDNFEAKNYYDYIYKLEDTAEEFKEELEGQENE